MVPLWAGGESATYGASYLEGGEIEMSHASSIGALRGGRGLRKLRFRADMPGGARRPSPGPLETPWYDSAMKKRPDWPKLPGWKTFKGLQASGGFGTPPSVLRELMAKAKKRQPPRSPARTAKGPRSRAAK